jgi:hypothetical protein
MSDKLLAEQKKLRLAQFCDAVRAKPQWFFKILDKEKDLGRKWADEAALLEPETISDTGEPNIQDAIE